MNINKTLGLIAAVALIIGTTQIAKADNEAVALDELTLVQEDAADCELCAQAADDQTATDENSSSDANSFDAHDAHGGHGGYGGHHHHHHHHHSGVDADLSEIPAPQVDIK